MEDVKEKSDSIEALLGLGIWSIEDLSNPNKELYYKTTDLERSDENYKCFSCPYQNAKPCDIVRHILYRHPRFVHKPIVRKRKSRKKAGGWTREELDDPNVTLRYTTAQLQKIDRKFQCLCCTYASPQATRVINHISVKHPKFVHDSFDKKNRRGTVSWTKEELSNPEKTFCYTTADLEIAEGKYKCFQCSYDAVTGQNVVKHITSAHPRFVHRRQQHKRQSRSSHERTKTPVYETRKKAVSGKDLPKRRSARNAKIVNYFGPPCSSSETESGYQNNDIEMNESESYEAHGQQAEQSNEIDEWEDHQDESVQQRLIFRFKEEIIESSEVVRLLNPKEEPAQIPAGDHRQLEFQERLDAKDQELEDLKSKFMEHEKEATRRENEMAKKLSNAQSEISKLKKYVELKKMEEDLRLAEEAEQEADKVLLRTLEDKKRAKEERQKEMEKIRAEISLMN